MIRDLSFHFLGTGTSSGVPVVGCECPVCTSDDPRDNRLRCTACLQFTDAAGQERAILIDTSPDLREQVLRLKLKRCDGILYTHNHADHVFGLDEVRRFNVMMKAPIEIYADENTLQSLHRIYRYIFQREKNVNDSFVATLIPNLIDPDQPIDLHGLRFTPLRLLHGRLPILGFRIEALDESGAIAEDQPAPLPLAYCTDVSAIPPDTWPQLVDLRTLVLDLLRYRHHPTHLTVDQAVEIAERVGADRTWFIHMTHDVRHAELDSQLPAGMNLAYDGLALPD
jgi:phosphoribosyl 1,2-cyclic phosphate phosphodiesterase